VNTRNLLKAGVVWLTVAWLSTILAACGTLEMGVEQPPTPDSSAATVAALATQNAELANRVATLTAPTLTPTREQTTALSALPPGFVFGTNTGLWKVGEDGQPRQILNRSDVVLSPDGTQALYTTPDADLWLIDLTTGEERNLTGTPDRMECCPQWWPARPGTIIFGSWPKDTDLGPSTGFLTTVQVDSSGYRVLSESQSNAWPAPAPDGQTIACDQGGTAYLYRWDTGPVPFDPAAYGLPVQRIGSPAWSPDGGRLAWVVGGDFGQGWRIGLGVFDLEARTARLLHPFEPRGVGGWPGAAVWSPDGQWLAYAIWPAADPNEEGICVFRADGEEEHCLGPGGGPIWSPDGRRLAFRRDSALWLAEAGTWDLLRVADDAWPVAWLRTDTPTPAGPEGQLALLIGGPPLSLVNLAGGPPQTLGAENMATDSALFFQWSPDGEKIVYGADADLWLLDAKSGESQNLTDNDRWDLMPTWSPDGDWIAFTSRPLLPGESKTGAMQGAWGGALAVIGANGIGFRILDDEGNVITPPSWTPTGRRLAYAADGEVRLYDLDTSQRTVLSSLDFGLTDVAYMGDPAWSPDGRFIALTACASSDKHQIPTAISATRAGPAQSPLPTPTAIPMAIEPLVTAAMVRFDSWSPDSETLAYWTFTPEEAAVSYTYPAGTLHFLKARTGQICSYPYDAAYGYGAGPLTWLPDGKVIVHSGDQARRGTPCGDDFTIITDEFSVSVSNTAASISPKGNHRASTVTRTEADGTLSAVTTIVNASTGQVEDVINWTHRGGEGELGLGGQWLTEDQFLSIHKTFDQEEQKNGKLSAKNYRCNRCFCALAGRGAGSGTDRVCATCRPGPDAR